MSIITNAVLQVLTRRSTDVARREELEHQILERRYEDRLKFLNEFLEEADRLMAQVLDAEYKNYGTGYDGPPADFIDGPEHDKWIRPLRAALSRLHLVASPACRAAASTLEKRVSDYTWDWKNYKTVQTARDESLETARTAPGRASMS